MKILSIILTAFILFLIPALSPAEDLQQDMTVEDEYNGYDDFEEYEIDEDYEEINDPIEPWNRLVFKFNDKFYVYIFKPVAKTYNAVLPERGRISVRNFFYNLTSPVRLANDLLQFKMGKAGDELLRFGINTTFGFAGLFDVAEKNLCIKKHNEDLGQTLGNFGLGDGFYIVWPFLGPSSLRDTVGLAGDSFLEPINLLSEGEDRLGVHAYKHLNNGSLRMDDYDDLKESALDPYTAFKDAYFQYRQGQIKK